MALFGRRRPNPVLTAVAAELNAMSGRWQVEGDRVRSHRAMTVSLEPADSNETFHIHPTVWLDPANPYAPVFRDCVVAPDREPTSAVRLWAQTTAATVLELLDGRSRFADHVQAGASDGWPDRHLVCGPVTGWGSGEGLEILQRWHVEHPVPPELRAGLVDKVSENGSGVKIFYGSQRRQPTAEVRINGVVDATASKLLLDLEWPRFVEPAYMRMYFIAY